MRERVLFVVAVLAGVLVGLGAAAPAAAQQVPADVEQYLRERGLTPEQAIAEARRLGIDLSNPEQAIARARALGVPEGEIRRLLALAQTRQASPIPYTALPAIRPDSLPSVNPRKQKLRADSLRADSLRGEGTTGPMGERLRERFVDPETGLPYFGYETFAGLSGAFDPDTAVPADEGYVVAAGDELRLTAYGAAEFQYDLTVDRDGRVFIPNVGQITVAGDDIATVRGRLRGQLGRRYAGLVSSPATISLDVTVTRLRPVRVFVTGEVAQPGAYTVSPGSSVFNLLYAVGGPTLRGSLRNIQVSRGGQVVATVDAYDFLIEGRDPGAFRLQSNDRILIPIRGKTAYVDGAVNRPAIYELRPGERFEDVLRFAGGLLPEAYVARFQVERIIPFTERTDPSVAREVLDLDLRGVLTGVSDYAVADGDRITVFSIARAEALEARARLNAVTVGGAVLQPGRYELGGELRTVRDLLARADGLTGNAYRPRAELLRFRPNLERELIPLDLDRVLRNDPTQNLPLARGDSLYVYEQEDFRLAREVTIAGEVLSPGVYALLDGMTLRDLLFVAGGLNDPQYLQNVFLGRADLVRRTGRGDETRGVPFDLGEVLDGGAFGETPLAPGDVVRVYPAEVDLVSDQFVEISGAVKEPGRYPLSRGMTVQDLVLQAQGLVEGAFTGAVDVTRMATDRGTSERRAVQVTVPLRARGGAPLGASLLDPSAAFGFSSVFPDTTRGGFELQHRDRVFVRMDPSFRPQAAIVLAGEVLYPGEYTLLRDGERLSELIARAGGLREEAYPKGGRLIRNGEQLVVRMDRAIRGDERQDVALAPGDSLFIPVRPNTVAVRGAVAIDGFFRYEPGRRVSYYLEQAGGLAEDADQVLLTQASGATFRIRRGLFTSNPVVDDGAVVTVSQKPPRTGSTDRNQVVRDALTITASTLTALIPIIVLILNR